MAMPSTSIPNCDCTYPVRFDGKSNVEGYDPEKYLFYDKSWYNDLTGEYERFAPDPAIAQSWQRLAEGKPLPHDITLINHERYEMRLKKETPGISHSDAHSQATMKYNYQDEADIYYATLRESKKNRQ